MSSDSADEATQPVPVGASAASFHGWRVVAAGMVAQACGTGLLASYGVLARTLTVEFDTSMATIAMGMSILILTGGVTAPVLGIALDRGPIRAIMLAGVGTMLGGMLLMSHAGTLLTLGASVAVVAVGIAMYGQLPVNVLLLNWFVKRRGTALAVAAMGMSASGFAIPPLTALLLEAFGWRDTLSILALFCAAAAFPAIGLWVVKRPEDRGQLPDGRRPDDTPNAEAAVSVEPQRSGEILRDRNFWILALGLSLAFAVPIVHAVHLIPYLLDIGIDLKRAALVHSIGSVSSLGGKLLAGVVADRLDKRLVIVAVFLLQLGGWLVILVLPTYAAILFASVLLGLGVGGLIPLAPILMGACFGREVIGRVSGLGGPVHLPFLLAAAPLVGLVYDTTGSYVPAFLGVMGTLVLAGLVLLLLRFPQAAEG